MKYFTLIAALLGATAFTSSAHAQDLTKFLDDIEVTSSIDTVSEYVFRGVSLGSSSLQPGTEFSVYGFTAGTWYSAGFGENSAAQVDELNFYGGYQFPFDGPIQVGVGGTAYVFPQGNNIFSGAGGTTATYEVNGTVGAEDVFLSPSVFAAYDFTLDNFTIEGNLSHSFDLPRDGWSAELGLNGGHVELDSPFQATTIDKAFDSYQYGTASIAANKVITDDISFFVSGNFTVNTEDDTLDFDIDTPNVGFNDSSTAFWFGTGFSASY